MDEEIVKELLLKHISVKWAKVAMVVGSVLIELLEEHPNEGGINIHGVLLELAEDNIVEIVGNAKDIRASEVRLCQ